MKISNNKIPYQVAAFHDLSCYGRSSLTTIIPLLTKFNIKVCPIPTALLSTHTVFENPHFVDLTNEMEPIIKHWKKLNFNFKGIYSGFLGNEKQAEIVLKFIKDFKKKSTLVIVDPVLGDFGILYPQYDQKFTVAMRELIKKADIITPNLTEFFLLLEQPFNQNPSDEEILEGLKKLTSEGPKVAIVTGVYNKKNPSKIFIYSYQKKNKSFKKYEHKYFKKFYPGTGDSFTSLLIGNILQGKDFNLAIKKSVLEIEKMIKISVDAKMPSQVGLKI